MTTTCKSYLHILIEHLGKLLHFHQTYTNQRGLGVGAQVQSVDETGAQSNHVLQGATQLDTDRVVDEGHSEIVRVEQHLELFGVVALAVTMP